MIGVTFNSQSNNDFYDPGIFLFTASSNLPIKKGVFRFLDTPVREYLCWYPR
jgi:hypothetical protein